MIRQTEQFVFPMNSEYSENPSKIQNLNSFYDGIIEIETSIKYGGYEILLKYTDIDIPVVKNMYYEHHTGYIRLVDALIGNLKLCNHLLLHSNINIHYDHGSFALGFCKNHDLELIMRLSEKINLLNSESYCWEGFFLRKDLGNEQSIQILNFLISIGLRSNHVFVKRGSHNTITPIELSKKFDNIHRILVINLSLIEPESINESELPFNNLQLTIVDETKKKKSRCIIV